MASTRGRPPAARARQAASLLARKGYPPGLTFRLIREAMEAEGTDDAIGLDLDTEPYVSPEDNIPEDDIPEPGYSL